MILINALLFLIFVSRWILLWVRLWQIKEYRLDRMMVHLRDTLEGRRLLFSSEAILLTFGLASYVGIIFSDVFANFYPFLVFGILSILASKTIQDILEKNLKRPIFTLKAIVITASSILTMLIGLLFSLTDISFWIIFLCLVSPFVVALYVYLFAFPTEIYTDVIMQRAKQKRATLKNLTVIAVSGSYGKSSTKEAIAHMLSKKLHVVKTPLSNNTPLSIAKTILNHVSHNTDIFVVELGAYKKGEIAQLASIVQPTIGVTTAISDQHLALYGSLQNVIESELELYKHMSKQAMVLLNKNSPNINHFASKIKQRNVITYEIVKALPQHVKNIYAFDVIPNTKGVSWQYISNQYRFSFKTPLLGVQSVENILPAILLGKFFGMSRQELQNAASSLAPLHKTMERVKLKNGIEVVDDTFNASPESIIAAISYLSLFPKRKILIMSPLIELGKNAQQRHIQLGKTLSVLDIVILTNKNFYSQIYKGIQSRGSTTQMIIGSYRTIAQTLRSILRKTDAVVFEGKEAGVVLSLLR